MHLDGKSEAEIKRKISTPGAYGWASQGKVPGILYTLDPDKNLAKHTKHQIPNL